MSIISRWFWNHSISFKQAECCCGEHDSFVHENRRAFKWRAKRWAAPNVRNHKQTSLERLGASDVKLYQKGGKKGSRKTRERRNGATRQFRRLLSNNADDESVPEIAARHEDVMTSKSRNSWRHYRHDHSLFRSSGISETMENHQKVVQN